MRNKLKVRINKYIEYSFIKIKQFLNQKHYKYKNSDIKYMLEENKNAKELIVVFSACTRPGIPARYNYVRTLKDIKANKLFILDDFGIDKRGGYYLGRYPEFLFEEATIQLINYVIKKINSKKIYFVGSSKGGYAALNFGCLYEKSVMIIGAPQFFLGNFLSAPANEKTMVGMNINSSEEVNFLNSRLKEKIKKNKNIVTQKIYIHYSNKEHTFKDHICDLIKDLKKNKYNIIEDVQDYVEHGDVSLYYPEFLIKSLKSEGVE